MAAAGVDEERELEERELAGSRVGAVASSLLVLLVVDGEEGSGRSSRVCL